MILPEHLPGDCWSTAGPATNPIDACGSSQRAEIVALEEVERRYVSWAAKHFPGERRELADRLGISERTLYRKLAAMTTARAGSQPATASGERTGKGWTDETGVLPIESESAGGTK